MTLLGKFLLLVKKIPLPLFLCVIVLVVMSPALKNGFVDWDDVQYIISNQALRGPWSGVFTAFPGYYHPLTILTYKIEFVLFGLSPFPYHLSNVLLHLAACVSAFCMFRALGARGESAFMGALLFGVHPVHVEPVAWISGRKELLWGLFAFWTIISYLKFVNTGRKRFIVGSLLFFILSALSKPFALALPFVILLTDYCLHREWNRQLLAEKAMYFMIALPLFLLSYAPSGFLLHNDTGLSGAFSGALAACKNTLFYLQKLVLPMDLSALYPQLTLSESRAGYLCVFSLIAVSLAVLAFRPGQSARPSGPAAEGSADRKRRKEKNPEPFRKLVFGAGFFLAMIFPALPILVPADRYNYVPAAGLCFLYGEFTLWLYGVICESRLKSAGESPRRRGAAL